MTAPTGQKNLPFQTPNGNAPLVTITDADVSTQLKDSLGKPVTGKLILTGYITQAWRYMLGQFVRTSGAVTTGALAAFADTTGTLIEAAAALSIFTATEPGQVPASGAHDTSGSYLGGDAAFHALPSPGLVYLGTVSVSGGALADTTILAANNSTYRSFELVFRAIIPGTNAVSVLLQVHSGGSFQATSYLGTVFANHANGGTTNGVFGTTGIPLATSGLLASSAGPGISGRALVSGLSGTSAPKQWNGHTSYQGSAIPDYTQVMFAYYWNSNGAIDGFQIVASSGSLTSGSVDIYGVL